MLYELAILGLAPQALCFRPLRGLDLLYELAILGLAPQALCFRPLRGLDLLYELAILGLAPQALCFRPLRGLAGGFHQCDEALEMMLGVVWAGGGFRMILHGDHG